MTDLPYDSKPLPNGCYVDFYNSERDLSRLSPVDRAFGRFEEIRTWKLRGTQLIGQVLNDESVDECINRLWKDVLKEDDFIDR